MLDKLTIDLQQAAADRVTSMINRGEIEREFAQAESEHQFWTILSAQTGLKYTRERS